jgi:phage terminase large subunit-like protein
LIASAALSHVQQYIDGVLSGEIVVGELVRLAVERHVADLAKQNTDDFPYVFDADQAAIAIDFFGSVLVHTIGEFVGMPFILEPWQAFGVANIFGWRRMDGTRRFRRVYWSTARKNGKSTTGAGIAIEMAMFDRNPVTGEPEEVSEVIIAATKKDQAEIIYKECLRMRAKSRWLSEISHEKYRRLTFTSNGGYIRAIGSDRSQDGLNTHCTIKDELHAWTEAVHGECYNTITTGGATRTQPMDVTVTTAGSTSSMIWLKEYDHACGVLRGIYKHESTFALCFEIDKTDDPFDESVWVKANPNLGASVKIQYLREQASLCHDDVTKNVFTRYHCNRLVSNIASAFSLDQWDQCKAELSDWSESDAIGAGIDIGGQDDLASYGLVARFDTGRTMPALEVDGGEVPIYRYEMQTRTYLATTAARDITEAPMCDWLFTGKINQCEHPMHELLRDLLADCTHYQVYDVAYDPSQALLLAEQLEIKGIVCASMGQNMGQFTAPINDLRNAIREGRFRHNGDPVLRWCVSNAVAKQDGGAHCMYDKPSSTEKIDALVAGTMGYRRAMVAPGRAVGELFVQ